MMRTTPICDRHMSDSDYVVKRYLDYSAVKTHCDARVRALYRRKYQEVAEKLQQAVENCEECKREVAAIIDYAAAQRQRWIKQQKPKQEKLTKRLRDSFPWTRGERK